MTFLQENVPQFFNSKQLSWKALSINCSNVLESRLSELFKFEINFSLVRNFLLKQFLGFLVIDIPVGAGLASSVSLRT
jgi:uncharacterized membrane protein